MGGAFYEIWEVLCWGVGGGIHFEIWKVLFLDMGVAVLGGGGQTF